MQDSMSVHPIPLELAYVLRTLWEPRLIHPVGEVEGGRARAVREWGGLPAQAVCTWGAPRTEEEVGAGLPNFWTTES
jgi:hypothetical protein